MLQSKKIAVSREFGALTAGILALLLAGCETIYGGSDAHPLTAKTWRLVNVETEGGSVKLARQQQDRHTLTFNADGTLEMKLDCNNGKATWNASDSVNSNGTLNISRVAATRALCPPPTWGEDLAIDLPTSTGYTLKPSRKGLVIRARRVVYVFAAN